METAMTDKFAVAAQQLAVREIEREITEISRQYEDAQMNDDPHTAAWALNEYAEKQAKLERLTGTGQDQQQQQNVQLTQAEQDFLAQRARGGEQMTEDLARNYQNAANRALGSGFRRGSPEYFASISGQIDNGGDGRSAPLDARQAARLCGISDQEYAAGQEYERTLRRAGYRQD
jgi:hypothetical protein